MTFTNPSKDRVAFAGVGRSDYHRDLNSADTTGAATLRACQRAIADAGILPSDVDGVCGSMVNSQFVQEALGLGEITWFANPELVIGNQLMAAHAAIASGAAEVVIVYHTVYRLPFQSKSASADPFRQRAAVLEARSDYRGFFGTGHVDFEPYGLAGPSPYAAWASRYLHEYGVSRDRLGLVAINAHSNAALNPEAILRTPLTMDQYLGGRMIREPLTMYDMDVVVDGADAWIMTTAERAADMRHAPVLVHNATLGRAAESTDLGTRDLNSTGQQTVARRLREGSDIDITSVDVLLPYDGFSVITPWWLESLGFCGRGEGCDFLAAHWNSDQQRVLIDGRVPVNPHGGSLTEGATQGAGHVREAIKQLRGDAGDRQVEGAQTALVTPGGILYNPAGFLLRTAS